MGRVAVCVARLGRRTSEGRALLESSELIFRGDFRLVIPFKDMRKVSAARGRLTIAFPGGTASFELGDQAARWAEKIASPPSRLDKLGVKPGSVVRLIGMDDDAFRAEIDGRGASLTARGPAGLVFLGAKTRADLARIAAIERSMPRDGALWVIWPKGRPELKEDHVRQAALAAGLTDVKVAAFSATHSALKLVVPLARR